MQNPGRDERVSLNGIGGSSTGNADEQQWTDAGNAAAQEGDYEGAVEAFERAVAANPDSGRSRYNLALAQQYLDDKELAIAGYRRAIGLCQPRQPLR